MRSYRKWTADDLAQLRVLCEKHQTPAIAKALGRELAAVRNKIRELGLKTPPNGSTYEAPAKGSTFASPLTTKPLSVEDVVQLFKIDLDLWEPTHVAPNVWMIGSRHPETGQILTAPLYQTKVTFKRKPEASNEELARELMADLVAFSECAPRKAPHVLTLPRGERFALEPDLFDIHIGKYAWKEETGSDYDSDLAEKIASAALSDLLLQAKGYPISEVILPLGNDFYHVDNPQGETTAGTSMDRDTRYQRMFRIGCRLAGWMIERCAEIAPTKVIVVPGNHDQISAFTMGVVMEARFANDPRVTFDNSPKHRKYYRYGKNLLGFAHGHGEKPDALAQLMPLEEPEAWSQTVCREFHLGHFHTSKKRDPITVDDKTSVTLRWMRSLSGVDAWHSSKGFLGRRHAEAFLWREAGGMRAHFVTLPIDDLLAAS